MMKPAIYDVGGLFWTSQLSSQKIKRENILYNMNMCRPFDKLTRFGIEKKEDEIII